MFVIFTNSTTNNPNNNEEESIGDLQDPSDNEKSDPALLGIKKMISKANKINLNEVAPSATSYSAHTPTNQQMQALHSQTSTNTSNINNGSDTTNTANKNTETVSSTNSSAKLFASSSLTSNTSILSENLSSPAGLKLNQAKSRVASSISSQEVFNLGDSLKRANNGPYASNTGAATGSRNPAAGFATIKTAQAIVSEEQSQREHQDVIEFQNLKRQHTKLLKALEIKLRAELDELKLKTEKEYNQELQQSAKDFDAICLRHGKELEELVIAIIYVF